MDFPKSPPQVSSLPTINTPKGDQKMFFNPRLNRERKGGEIVFTAETEVNIPRIIASDYIKKTVNKELVTDLVPEGATACKKLTFKVGFTDEIKEKIEKHTRISGDGEEYAVLLSIIP